MLTDTDLRKDGFVSDLYLLITPDNLRPWRSGREVVNKIMTEKEFQYAHAKNAFLADVLFALENDLLSADDMIDIIKLISKRMDENPHTYIISKVGVPVKITDDEIQHVAYDDAQLGREK